MKILRDLWCRLFHKHEEIPVLDEAEQTIHLAIYTVDDECLVGLTEGATPLEALCFIEEAYEKGFIFGFTEDLMLVSVGVEFVRRIAFVSLDGSKPEKVYDPSKPKTVEFKRKK